MAALACGPVHAGGIVLNQPVSASERGRFITPPAGLLSKLRAFDFGRDCGIKPAHVPLVTRTCRDLWVLLLLRATNSKSIPWMGLKGYTAKPIDCKPKTARREVAIGSYLSDCAGLVVDPNRVGAKAFDGDDLSAASKAWADFEAGLNTLRTAPGVNVYLRAERKGFYAVDTGDADTQTRHHGCLMVSEQAPPEGFDPRRPHSRRFIDRHMAYLHGDYDLYAIIDLDGAEEAARNPGKVNELFVRREMLLGQGNLVTPRTAEVVERLNAMFGVDLVKHGEQSAYGHAASDVYIFEPNGEKRVLAASGFAQPEQMVAWFEQFFRYYYKTGYARG